MADTTATNQMYHNPSPTLKKVYVISTYGDAQIIPTLPVSMLKIKSIKFKAECKMS
jgi:hypothetical protein